MFLPIITRNSESVPEKHISPERGKFFSPGQRPGDKIAVIFKALKGRNMIIGMHIYIALSGLYFIPILLHRALPCAVISCPFRAIINPNPKQTDYHHNQKII
jgi:hypothetical protein